MNSNCNNIIYWKHIDILIFLEVAGHFHIDIYIYSVYIIHIHTTPAFLHLHFLSPHWVVTFDLQIIRACDVFTFNEIFFLRSQKGDGVADVDYLKGVFALSGLQPPASYPVLGPGTP